jgi:GT2 family glycosyltransferase
MAASVDDVHRHRGGPSDEPRVAVVVATRNRSRDLGRALGRLTRLWDAPGITVVDNASSDGTGDMVRRRFPDVRIIELAQNQGPAARTVGVEHARSEYVAFADDDSWWQAGSLMRAAELFDRYPRLGLLAGRVLVGPDERLDPVSRAMAASPLCSHDHLPGRPVLGFVACGAIVRRSAFLDAGGFRGDRVGGEEALLAIDLASRGWALCYVDEIVAHHHPSSQRDGEARSYAETVNTLTTAWARRPAASAARATARAVIRSHREPVRRALLRLLRDAPSIARERRPAPEPVERQLRLLEAEENLRGM